MTRKFYWLVLIALISFFQPLKTAAANFIVAADGSGNFTTVQAAIDACPDAVRSYIFIKNGTYYGQTSIGSKATASTKLISLIGENKDSVILTYDVACSATVVFEQSCTFQIYAKNFYAENVTFQNSAGNTGQALALYTAGDMAILKNCKLLGYQDTYRSKKGTRAYLLNCWIEGAVDFIYAGGTLIFDDCTIYCTRAGGFISAPEDAYASVPKTSTATGIFLRLGFLYRNCTIKGPSSVAANSFYLGRPWGDYAGAIYVNCKLSNQVSTAGWATMGTTTYLTACFTEYNSMDLNGVVVDTTKRVTWSKQLKKSDVDNFLSPAAFFAKSYTTTFEPISASISPETPTDLVITSGNTLTWKAVAGAAGYQIFANRKMVGYATTNQFDITNLKGPFEIKALSSLGVLSEISTAITSIHKLNNDNLKYVLENGKIHFPETAKQIEIFDISGRKLQVILNSAEVDLNPYLNRNIIVKKTTFSGEYQTIKLKL